MLKKRIIPCLDIKDGRTVKGIHFEQIKDAGDPIELAKKYVSQGADELVFLDISATNEERSTMIELVKLISKEINIPFTVGGGIKRVEDVALLIKAGADKVSINSYAVKNPNIISEISRVFGSQCVTVAMDIKWTQNEWKVYTHGGQKETNWEAMAWAKEVSRLGAGEILLTSMDNDGAKSGFAIEITDKINKAVPIPVIASGGAGSKVDFLELFENSTISAGLAASVFHYGEIYIPELKNYLKTNKIAIR